MRDWRPVAGRRLAAMILVPCPWCGPRDAAEFRCLGAARRRPDPAAVTVEDWRDHLYLRANLAGDVTETWYHRMGCRQYVLVVRDTTTNDIRSARPSRATPNPAAEESQ